MQTARGRWRCDPAFTAPNAARLFRAARPRAREPQTMRRARRALHGRGKDGRSAPHSQRAS
eukprot:8279703-Pyramimonas_sp.AAC.1